MSNDQQMPKDKGLDHSLKLLHEGYSYIINRKNKFNSKVFETTLLGEKAICLIGEEAAKVFYDRDKFKRENAAPKPIEKTLFGEGGVQGLDGEAHRNRKAMFMNLMTNDRLKEIQSLTEKEWEEALKTWETKKKIVLYEESKKILTKVAFKWVGIPIHYEDVTKWADQLGDMFEKAANIGVSHFKSRRSRNKAEKWLEDVVKKVRHREIHADEDRALFQFAFHKDENGDLLDKHTVAVEILNLLRPIVAISVYLAFTGLAAYEYPIEIEKVRNGGEEENKRFIQEVRRYYPFFPFAVARVKNEFTWGAFHFDKDTLTLLDLYGTNHLPEVWSRPDEFQPDRFKEWSESPFDFIPQGGGEFDIGHRCAGEWITIDILRVSLNFLINRMTYHVPDQDLEYALNDIPSLPKSKLILTDIKGI